MRYTLSQINHATGFAMGARFHDDDEVRAYFTPENQEWMFGREAEYEALDEDTLGDMAEAVIENRWWYDEDEVEDEALEAARVAKVSP